LIVYDPQKHVKYKLGKGREFIIDNYRDQVLRDGYYQASAKRKRIWIDIMEDLIQRTFNKDNNTQRKSGEDTCKVIVRT
jgi:hypothetical protein